MKQDTIREPKPAPTVDPLSEQSIPIALGQRLQEAHQADQAGDVLLIGQLETLERRLKAFFNRSKTRVLRLKRAADSLDTLENSELACAIIDVDTVDIYGPKLVEMVKERQPNAWVIAAGQYVLPEFREQLFRAGADAVHPLSFGALCMPPVQGSSRPFEILS